ncbi:MAG: hypothetical protein ACRDRA_06405 [Pseudonocardiaceae bacterium]
MSDREPASDLATWIALRRAHEGGVANLEGQWFDSGRPVPGYLANALDGLTNRGLLVLADADPRSCGVRRATVTDTGSARYVALCQTHNPGVRLVRTPHRWAHSTSDQRAHLLAERGTEQVGVLIAVCGHRMLWSVGTTAQPTGRNCPTCQALPVVEIPAPQLRQFPDSGRLPVEQPPPAPAPGGRPDTTARLPCPQFPIDIPAGRRSSSPEALPAPGGQPDPGHRAEPSGVGQLRWALPRRRTPTPTPIRRRRYCRHRVPRQGVVR